MEQILQDNKATFFFKVERELEKVNSFYLQKEAELKLRIKILCEKRTIAHQSGALTSNTSITFISLHEGFQRFRRDLDKLEQFIELNATGFSKVLKKWDKRSKSQTKELYLSRAVEVQPIFHREKLAEMSDLASSCILELEAWADGDSVIFEGKGLREDNDPTTPGAPMSPGLTVAQESHKATDDLYHEFIKTASSQYDGDTKNAIADWIQRLSQMEGAKSRITKIFLLSITKETSDSALIALYESGYVDLNAADEINGQNCLHKAALSGKAVVLDLALKHHVDSKITDAYGRNALHYACINNHREFIKPLLDAGADINAFDKDNFSPLLYSIIKKYSGCVSDLIALGAKVDLDSEKDYIPLNLACQYGVYGAVKILLDSSPSLVKPDAEGLFPIHVAARAGHHELVPLLMSYNMDVNKIDKLNKWTALFYAASEGHSKVVSALIAANAQVDAMDEDGHTSLYYASWEGHFECMQEIARAMSKAGITTDPSISMALGSSTTANSSPLLEDSNNNNNNSDPADLVDAMDISCEDIDGIPDLSLPPPILPLRRYGHNFLDKKIFVQLFFDTAANPIQFDKGDAAFPAGRLTIASRNDRDIIPRSISLPLSDNDRTVSFQVDSLEKFAIDFEIYPTYGTRIIAKSSALPYIFNNTNTTENPVLATIQTVTLPLFDMRLRTVGKFNLRFQIVRPFGGEPLEITKFDTYWKSTSKIEQQLSTSAHQESARPSSDQSQVQQLLESQHTASPVINDAGLFGRLASLSAANAYSTQSYHHGYSQALSLVTASSLSGEYCHILICLTRDLVPVVASHWQVEIQHGVKIPIGNLTLETLLAISSANSPGNTLDSRLNTLHTARDHNLIHETIGRNGIIPLAEFLKVVPVEVKFDVCVLYPTSIEASYMNIGVSTFPEINRYVDIILTTLFDHVREIRGRRNEDDAPFGGTPNHTRSLIFSSAHPDVCTVLNWKQPNYPVFFSMNAVSLTSASAGSGQLPTFSVASAHGLPCPELDRRCTSLREATSFAANNNLLGIVCNANMLALVPSLVGYIRGSGLVLVADAKPTAVGGTGGAGGAGAAATRIVGGVDGVRNAQSLVFKDKIDM